MEFTGKLVDVSRNWKTGKFNLTFEMNEDSAIGQVDEISKHEKLSVNVDEYKKKKKRSLDANKYCWKLCDAIARKIHSTKEEVYRSAIRSVGAFNDVQVLGMAVESLMKGWEHNGTGWFAEIVDNVAEMKTVRLYYGSSSYNSQQMSRLIDEVIGYCKDLEIEHLTPDELARMKASWRNG